MRIANRKKKKIAPIMLIVIALLLCIGVGAYVIINNRHIEDKNVETALEDNEVPVDNTSGEDVTTSDEPSDEVTFEFLSHYTYGFSSGAGAWCDNFYIEKDGYFHGNYQDTDMGDVGDDYPYGTINLCDYSGHFGNIRKIDDYTYAMDILDIEDNTKYQEDTIKYGVRYVNSEPYALGHTQEIQIYLPGKPTSEIDEEVGIWLRMYDDEIKELPGLALVNPSFNGGIRADTRQEPVDDARQKYSYCEDSIGYYKDDLSDANSTTVDLLRAAELEYDVADDCLNYIWLLVKYNVPEEKFQTILEEQRQWNKEKEEVGKEYNNTNKYGTLGAVEANDQMADMTMERCQKLIDYLRSN